MAGYDDEDEFEPNPFPPYYDHDADEWIEPGEEDDDDETFDEDYNEDDRDDWS